MRFALCIARTQQYRSGDGLRRDETGLAVSPPGQDGKLRKHDITDVWRKIVISLWPFLNSYG